MTLRSRTTSSVSSPVRCALIGANKLVRSVPLSCGG
jgi:hypothetical protein